MTEGTLGCRRLDVIRRPARLLLHFAIAPAGPDQFCRVATRQPLISWLALLWERDLNNFPMISFGRMVTDSRAKIFEVSASTTFLAASLGVGATCLAVD